MSNIKLLALDVDGTLVKEAGIPIAPRVVDAVRAASNKFPVVLCTGRSVEDGYEIVEELQLPPSYHVFGGGSIVVTPERAQIQSQYLTAHELDYLEQYFRSNSTSTRSYLTGTEWRTTVAPAERSRVGVFSLALGKIDQAMKIYNTLGELKRRFSVGIVTSSHDKTEMMVHFSSLQSHKGAGLQRVLDILGIDPKDVMAIGDMGNDIPMFNLVGHSVAMGHAPDMVKQHARYQTSSIDDDGVAVAIERWVLAK
jgi:HAD superfamily hydrolase (TIGR01484 family)